MITINLDKNDLANIRFAYSPLAELSLSYFLLRVNDRYRHSMYRHAWVDEAMATLDGVHLPYMDAVIDDSRFIPDFVVPPVGGTQHRMEDQLKQLYDVPVDLIVRDVQILAGYTTMTEERSHFIKEPHGALPCLIEEMWMYWNLVLAPHWPRIAATLESDVMYRARQLAQDGIAVVFNNIHQQLAYPEQDTLILQKNPFGEDGQLNGRGIQFYPTLFKPGLLWQIGKDWQPSVGYEARGTGVWYKPPEIETDEAIELTLGASKARLLTALEEPYTTSDLAHRLHLSAGAVSQQIGKLSQAGLVLSNRNGSRVYHRLSPRGRQLLEVFS
ncbi:MAG: helix-turn-helix domain-containing protein [Chloroflexota bacterium]